MGLSRRWPRPSGIRYEKTYRSTPRAENQRLRLWPPATRGTTIEGHAFTNIHNNLVEVKDIPEEVEKKAYDYIFLDNF